MNAGDVVKLKSGGANMTILSISEDDMASVVWMVEERDLRTCDLPVWCLTEVTSATA